MSFTEDVQKRYESYGWHVQAVGDVNSGLGDLREAIEKAKEATDRPSIIAVKTAHTHTCALSSETTAPILLTRRFLLVARAT